jgi:hypothetical protein
MKYGTPESYLCEARAKYLAGFDNIEEGVEALGLKRESKTQRRYWTELVERMCWYQRKL